jgi:hypothetical protein
MTTTFTGSEKVLYKMAYDFAIDVHQLSRAEAHQRGLDKVLSKRQLSSKVSRH